MDLRDAVLPCEFFGPGTVSSSYSLYNHFGMQVGGNGQGKATARCQHCTAELYGPRLLQSL